MKHFHVDGHLDLVCDMCACAEVVHPMVVDNEAEYVLHGVWMSMTLEGRDHPQTIRADLCSKCAAGVFNKLRRYEV